MHLFTSIFIQKPDHVAEIEGSVTAPQGFRAAGIAAGIKKSGKPDLGLLVSDAPCASATMYTPNAAAAPPVRVCQQEIDNHAIQALVVNSGFANACTGTQGFVDARTMITQTAAATGIAPERVGVSSTGVIGQLLPMGVIEPGIATAAGKLSETGGSDFAAAIRTTDTVDKEGAVAVSLAGGRVTIGACAKGAGMIAPNMATTLIFITTDAAVAAPLLNEMLSAAVAGSFNAISVDGDMSTNDCVFVLANGASGVNVEAGSDDAARFGAALSAVCKSLALKMVEDGEGATKVVELNLNGAADAGEAARVSQAIANSPLVKTAFFGRDANWGRIMASAGAALAGEPELLADIYYEDVCLALSGAAAPAAPAAERLREIMSQPEIAVNVDLHRGAATHTMYFSDLGHDYISLNAEYTT